MPDSQHDPIRAPVETPWRKSARGRTTLAAIVLLVLGIGGAVLFQWWTVGRFTESTNNAYLEADAVVIAPKISGYVKEVLVGDNEVVEPGKILVRIDSASYQAVHDIAEAEVAQRRADLVRFRADISRQEAARAEALAQIKVTQAAARFAASDAQRFQGLAKTGAVTMQRRDQADSARDQTAGQADAARAAVDGASRQLDSLQAQIGQGEAALRAAEAKARGTRNDLDNVAITAPIGGQVGDRTVRVGQFVQPGARLMTVVPVQDIYLVANFKETQLGRLRPGQKVHVTVDALPGTDIAGVVDSIAPGTGSEFALLPPENATGNFTKIVQRVPVRIRLDLDPALRGALRPGLSAEVAVDTKSSGSTK
jgi:membrane fusion protein (multidrug efflux system)